MRKRTLSLAVARALGAGASIGLVAPLACAQQAPPAQAVEKVQKIEVTGSRTPLETLESESPVLLVTQQAENRNLIPQRNCDRFSRSSMDSLVSLQKFQKTVQYPIRERVECQPAIGEFTTETQRPQREGTKKFWL